MAQHPPAAGVVIPLPSANHSQGTQSVNTPAHFDLAEAAEVPHPGNESTSGEFPEIKLPAPSHAENAVGAVSEKQRSISTGEQFSPWKTREDWRDYPGEPERPRFARIEETVDWVKLYELRTWTKRERGSQRRIAMNVIRSGPLPAATPEGTQMPGEMHIELDRWADDGGNNPDNAPTGGVDGDGPGFGD